MIHRRREELLSLLDVVDETETTTVDHDIEAGEDNPHHVHFYDSDLLIKWDTGRMKFRSDASKIFRFIKMIWEAGEDGIEHIDLATAIHKDETANITNMIHNARNKLEECDFPGYIENDGKKLWFE